MSDALIASIISFLFAPLVFVILSIVWAFDVESLSSKKPQNLGIFGGAALASQSAKKDFSTTMASQNSRLLLTKESNHERQCYTISA